jgi:DNA-directed RNA polymerase specialized sigma24 family protein
MDWDQAYEPQLDRGSRFTGDRFLKRGEDLIQEAALAAIAKHRSLPTGQAETFASTFVQGINKLNVA